MGTEYAKKAKEVQFRNQSKTISSLGHGGCDYQSAGKTVCLTWQIFTNALWLSLNGPVDKAPSGVYSEGMVDAIDQVLEDMKKLRPNV
jgi:hypothetical protein